MGFPLWYRIDATITHICKTSFTGSFDEKSRQGGATISVSKFVDSHICMERCLLELIIDTGIVGADERCKKCRDRQSRALPAFCHTTHSITHCNAKIRPEAGRGWCHWDGCNAILVFVSNETNFGMQSNHLVKNKLT